MKNAIDGLAQGVHHRIDRTAFPGLSGGAQTALLAGLRFLGLITADGSPTPDLHALAVPDEAARKKKLEAIIRARYAEVFALDLTKVTPGHLEDKMGEAYNVAGSTRDKAVRFFLGALEYLEIPVSPLFKKLGATAMPGRKRRTLSGRTRPGTTERDDDDDDDDGEVIDEPVGTSRTVTLRSGGTVTVTVAVDLFSQSDEDRTFVFDLIDKLKKYEQAP